MKVKVRPLQEMGKMLPVKVSMSMPPRVGTLQVCEERDRVLSRPVTRARLLDTTARAQRDLLPDLSDVRLLWAQDGRMRVTGFERVNDTSYAQTWEVELDGAGAPAKGLAHAHTHQPGGC